MTDDPRTLAATYFRSWKDKDFAALRSVLADDASFRGPLGQADDAETCMQGLKGLAEIITDIVIRKTFVDGPDVLTWFDLDTSGAPPLTVANWSHVERGKYRHDPGDLRPPPSPPRQRTVGQAQKRSAGLVRAPTGAPERPEPSRPGQWWPTG